jgi:hypothetical protein
MPDPLYILVPAVLIGLGAEVWGEWADRLRQGRRS